MTTRILVVDPDISFMVGLKQGLESSGDFRVSLAANAPAAEDALRHTRYDAAVVAFGLGSLDAMELIRALRAVQPGLRLITCPETPAQRERARFMDVQAVVPKPFSAAQLASHLHRILQIVTQAESPGEDFAPPQMPRELMNLARTGPEEVPEKPRTTGLLNRFKRASEAPPPTRPLAAEPQSEKVGDVSPAPEPFITPPELGDDMPPPPPVHRPSRTPTAELRWPVGRAARAAPPPTVEGGLEAWQASDATRPLPPLAAVSAAGAAPEVPAPDEAPAQSEPPAQVTRTREFDALVDSMRAKDESAPRRTRLDDLLASIAADAAADEPLEAESTLDYVLNAIRRSPPPTADEAGAADAALEDATIGDVIDGLFEPSFEGVLAALAGEEVLEEEDSPAPSYGGPGVGAGVAPQAEDQLGPESFGTVHELPPWLDEDEENPPALPHDEPALPPEEAPLYPATTALSAVSGTEDDDFSLSQLLDQIEHQLPEARSRRPRLKPLPSWEREADDETVRHLAEIFDRADEQADAYAFVEDSEPFDWAEAALEEAPAADLAPQTAEPPEEWADEEVQQAFLEGVRQEENVEAELWGPPPDWDWQPAAPAEVESLWAGEPDLAEPWTEPAASETSPEVESGRAEDWDAAPEDTAPPSPEAAGGREEEAIWEAPSLAVPEAAALAEAPVPAEEDDEAQLAQIAVLLTQFSLESSAQATLLTRPGTLIAQAGDLPAAAMARLFDQVDAAWRTSTEDAKSLIRFIALPEAGDFLLYSTRVERDLTLSMAFHANTPVRTIRRQAQRLGQSLELVPEAEARVEVERRAAAPPEVARDVTPTQPEIESEPSPEPAEDQGPHAAYTCLWLPYDSGVELGGDLADDLRTWIEEAAQSAAWELLEVGVQPEYVQVSLSVPQKIAPDDVIGRLMALTAARGASAYPQFANGTPLWADGYYVVSPPRDLTEREISRFITFQRQAALQD